MIESLEFTISLDDVETAKRVEKILIAGVNSNEWKIESSISENDDLTAMDGGAMAAAAVVSFSLAIASKLEDQAADRIAKFVLDELPAKIADIFERYPGSAKSTNFVVTDPFDGIPYNKEISRDDSIDQIAIREALLDLYEDISIGWRALCVGVDGFSCKGAQPRLLYAKKTAEDMANFLEEQQICPPDVPTFLNADYLTVSKNIQKLLNSNDSYDKNIIIYYCGHGIESGDSLYLSCADTTIDGSIISNAIPARDIEHFINKSHAKNVLVILDCCSSGSIKNLITDAIEQDSSNKNSQIWLTSSAEGQASFESQRLRGAVFSVKIMEYIRNGRADINNDGDITVAEVIDAVREGVLRYSSQEPQIVKRDADPEATVFAINRRKLFFEGLRTAKRAIKDLHSQRIISDHYNREWGAFVDELEDKAQHGLSIEQLPNNEQTRWRLINDIGQSGLPVIERAKKWDALEVGTPPTRVRRYRKSGYFAFIASFFVGVLVAFLGTQALGFTNSELDEAIKEDLSVFAAEGIWQRDGADFETDVIQAHFELLQSQRRETAATLEGVLTGSVDEITAEPGNELQSQIAELVGRLRYQDEQVTSLASSLNDETDALAAANDQLTALRAANDEALREANAAAAALDVANDEVTALRAANDEALREANAAAAALDVANDEVTALRAANDEALREANAAAAALDVANDEVTALRAANDEALREANAAAAALDVANDEVTALRAANDEALREANAAAAALDVANDEVTALRAANDEALREANAAAAALDVANDEVTALRAANDEALQAADALNEDPFLVEAPTTDNPLVRALFELRDEMKAQTDIGVIGEGRGAMADRQLQFRLAELGCYGGFIDGDAGPATFNAYVAAGGVAQQLDTLTEALAGQDDVPNDLLPSDGFSPCRNPSTMEIRARSIEDGVARLRGRFVNPNSYVAIEVPAIPGMSNNFLLVDALSSIGRIEVRQNGRLVTVYSFQLHPITREWVGSGEFQYTLDSNSGHEIRVYPDDEAFPEGAIGSFSAVLTLPGG